MALTQKQMRFCEEYIANGFNARKAYFTAFPNCSKENKQPSYPYCLLKKPEIKEYIESRRQEIYESLNVDAMRLATRLTEIAFAEKEDMYYTVSNQLKAIELIQKQMGLQNQKIEAKVEEINVCLVGDDEEDEN